MAEYSFPVKGYSSATKEYWFHVEEYSFFPNQYWFELKEYSFGTDEYWFAVKEYRFTAEEYPFAGNEPSDISDDTRPLAVNPNFDQRSMSQRQMRWHRAPQSRAA